MARYRGPASKIARKFGEPIFGPDKVLERKKHPPGIHGTERRRKPSEYAIQLKEKQKVKYTYGLLEKQFFNLFKKAEQKKGITGEALMQLLESRLDNIVYRLGIAPSRRSARQLVSHKHILLNDVICNIPSAQVKVGDLIGVREKSKSLQAITNSLVSPSVAKASWLEWDETNMKGKYALLPERKDIKENIKEQLIVELDRKSTRLNSSH